MAIKEKKKRSKSFKVLIGLIIALGVFELVAFGAIAVYLSDYSHADAEAEKALKAGQGVRVSMTDDWIEFIPSKRSQTAKCDRPTDDAAAGAATDSSQAGATADSTQAGAASRPNPKDTGIIFYPGGKVEYTAYAPLMQDFAHEGYFCALVKMPFNLAMLDTNAAKDVKEAHPEITHWLIGGHSLGGVCAAKYAAISDFDGLFLLAAYTTTNMSDKAIPVVSVYGDKDGVLNMDEYAANKSNLPADTIECVIQGGNHSQFGSYGLQEGDSKAGISAEEQRAQTVCLVLDNIGAAQ